jgi:Uma2 family endonuclease
MVALRKRTPTRMALDEFLAWAAANSGNWQLIDGEPVAMAPSSDAHGAIQSEVGPCCATICWSSAPPAAW